MEPVLLWAIAVSSRVSERCSNIRFPLKKRGPAEVKRNHFKNYVDSPLCRDRRLILCSNASSEVNRGWAESLIRL